MIDCLRMRTGSPRVAHSTCGRDHSGGSNRARRNMTSQNKLFVFKSAAIEVKLASGIVLSGLTVAELRTLILGRGGSVPKPSELGHTVKKGDLTSCRRNYTCIHSSRLRFAYQRSLLRSCLNSSSSLHAASGSIGLRALRSTQV